MTTRFLCANHRQWLQSNPNAANSHCDQTKDTGQWYREQGLWQQALPYLGSAFETAEIMLNLEAVDKAAAVINFTSCAILLADTWQKLGEGALSLRTFQTAQQRLLPEHTLCYQHKAIQACLNDCIKALARGAEMAPYLGQKNERVSLH